MPAGKAEMYPVDPDPAENLRPFRRAEIALVLGHIAEFKPECAQVDAAVDELLKFLMFRFLHSNLTSKKRPHT